MHAILVSLTTPYKENIRGTSALAYHLLKGNLGTNNPYDCTIYTFNANGLSEKQIKEVEEELNTKIKIIPLPRWYKWMFKFHLLFFRVFLKYPFVNYIKLPDNVVKEIKSLAPNMIWVNNEEMSRIVKQFPGIRRMQLGPDVESLYYYRMMGCRFVMNKAMDYWKCAMMYRKYARLERNFCSDNNYTYYAVGEADIDHLRQLSLDINCKFLRHPHYEVNDRREIHFHQPKIKLLIAGRYDLYMKQTADELINCLTKLHLTTTHNGVDILLKDNYDITFLGKGWEKHVNSLRHVGFSVKHITFAHNYIEEICKHDIQITPICIGTGTKGKVLDALANGLLVLGTPYALENIAVEHNKSCIEWHETNEVVDILLDIVRNKEKYEKIAATGREEVLKEHNPTKIASELFCN